MPAERQAIGSPVSPMATSAPYSLRLSQFWQRLRLKSINGDDEVALGHETDALRSLIGVGLLLGSLVIKSGLGNIETVTLYSSNWRGREQALARQGCHPRWRFSMMGVPRSFF